MNINQRSLSFSLEAREDGFHDLIFGSDNITSLFMPPDTYAEKLSWLEGSFQTYLSNVREMESLKNPTVQAS